MRSLAKFAPTFAASVMLALAAGAETPAWQSTLSGTTPGPFPALRPAHGSYRFGWSGFTAATADIALTPGGTNRSLLNGKVRTTDAVRALWPFEAEHSATADSTTLRPLEVKQIESVRSKRITTSVTFDAQGVTATRTENSKPPKVRRFDLPNLFDFQTAFLFLRSQSLADGNAYRIVVFPAKDPYLATITVEGRDRITVGAGTYNAIRMDLKLNKIGRNNELKPHKKFKKATVWLSDDADRILLRAEAEVFVGTVFAELQSARFDTQPRRD